MIRAQSGQTAAGEVINATTGAGFAGTVTVYITIDAGTQTIGSVGSGICANEGNGLFTYRPTAAETDGASVSFTFTGTGAIPSTTTYDTLTAGQAASISTATAPNSITVADLITQILQSIGVLQGGEAASAEDSAMAFPLINDFIASECTIARLMIYTITRSTWTIAANTQNYTIGTGGTINIERPNFVNGFAYIDTSVTLPVEISLGESLSDDAWQAIPIKSLTNTYPSYAYYNPTYTPYGTVSLWMIPTSTTLTGVIYAATAVTQFGALTDVISLPPGYNRFLRTNLAVELWPTFKEGVPLDPVLARNAARAMANVKRMNTRLVDLNVDAALLHMGGGYNIYSDTGTGRNH